MGLNELSQRLLGYDETPITLRACDIKLIIDSVQQCQRDIAALAKSIDVTIKILALLKEK